jgi:hypothetical protein
MARFLLWLLLLAVCWPLALVALVAWPVVWLLLLPLRLLGIAVDGAFALLRAIVMLPARLLGGGPRARAS